MKAFSIRQPYAFAVVMGYKSLENRDWKPRNPGLQFRGRVLIHAGIKEEKDDVEGVVRLIADQTGRSLFLVREDYEHNRHLGAIVGAATVHGVATESNSPWFNGPIALVLTDQKPCQPIPCKGQLGFFNVPRDVEVAVYAMRGLPAPPTP